MSVNWSEALRLWLAKKEELGLAALKVEYPDYKETLAISQEALASTQELVNNGEFVLTIFQFDEEAE